MLRTRGPQLASAALLACVAACTQSQPGNSAIAVTITVDPAVKSTCIRLVETPGGGGPEVLSDPVPSKPTIEAAVYPTGQLSGTISLKARGFWMPGGGCGDGGTAEINDESPAANATFQSGQIQHVALHVTPPSGSLDQDGDGFRGSANGGPDCDDNNFTINPAASEVCTNLIDDNCNQLIDCADPECPAGQACNDGDPCTDGDSCLQNKTCVGSAAACNTPPSPCFGSSGTCVADAGCVYPPNPGGSCNDNDLCTTGDLCLADGGCEGTPITCNTPPPCYTGTGVCAPSDGGCVYQVNGGATCNDGNACTANDSCQADGTCAGTAITCNQPPNDCFSSAGTCSPDAGCAYTVQASRVYQACDAGVCWADGGCSAPGFPYLPSNFDPTQIPPSSIVGSVVLNCPAFFDSTPDAAVPFSNWCGQPQPPVLRFAQDGGPDVVVLPIFNLQIPAGGNLQVSGKRPVIFAVFDSADISGQVTASANNLAPGAGGSTPSCKGTGGAGGVNTGNGSGGGGAGDGTAGAAGGASSTGAAGGTAGPASSNAPLIPLVGGCSGGAGGSGSAQQGLGGAGGGGVQFSVAHSLTVSGVVSVSGGGGKGASGGNSGGGGGGSGGALLLEAQSMSVASTAQLTANGGGGGQGAGNQAGADGQNGNLFTAAPAPGGTGGNGQGGSGGSGGAAGAAPTAGAAGTRSGGGGGGAVGAIRLNAASSCSLNAGAVFSPAPSKSGCP